MSASKLFRKSCYYYNLNIIKLLITNVSYSKSLVLIFYLNTSVNHVSKSEDASFFQSFISIISSIAKFQKVSQSINKHIYRFCDWLSATSSLLFLLICYPKYHDRNMRTAPRMSERQMAQLRNFGAQLLKQTRWPHGKKTVFTSSSKQTLHLLRAFNWRLSFNSLCASETIIYIYIYIYMLI